MIQKVFFLIVVGLMISCNNAEVKETPVFNADNSAYTYSGRTEVLNDSIRTLISPAAGVTFRTEADSINLLIGTQSDAHNYISIEINGEYYDRFRIEADSINHISIGLPSGTANEVGVFKATEASNGAILFYGAEAEDIASLEDNANFSIEFIGDSITCGMSADMEDFPCGEGVWYDQHNAYLAYGPRSARALNADFMLSSVSGMGMYRNWNDEDTAPVMGDVYETTYLNGNTDQEWDFSEFSPDLVSICLGTNDLSEGDHQKERKDFDKEKYTNAYIDFVSGIFEHYPNTKLALLTSPMISGEKGEWLSECLNKVKDNFADEHTVEVFEFKTITPHGCGSHPDIDDHNKMAEMLTPFYKELLNK